MNTVLSKSPRNGLSGRIYLCCFVVVTIYMLSFKCFAQTRQLDSLKTVLARLPSTNHSFESDTTKVMLLCQLGRGKDENGLFVGNYEQCIKWLDEAQTISQNIKWNKGLLISNLYAGVWHAWKGQVLQGLQKKQKAAYYAELEKNPFWLGIVYRHLGDQYYLLGDYDQTIRYLTMALEPSKADQITHLIATQNLGTAYYGKKDYKNALIWLEKAYSLCSEAKDQQLLKYVTLNWAEVCLATGDMEKLGQLMDEYPLIHFTDHAWDVSYFTLNAQRYFSQQKFKIALNELEKGLAYIDVTSDQHRQNLFLQLSVVYEKMGDADLALNYYKKYAALRETDIKLFQKKQTEYLKYEYDNQKQQDDIKLLNRDIAQQRLTRNTLWVGVILACSFVIFLIWSNRILDRKNKVIENQRSELLILQNQLSLSNEQLVEFNEELEKKVAERTQELVEANGELIRKNQEIQQAFSNGKTLERKRVASELHDNLGSTISGLIWQLQSIMPENLLLKEREIYEGLTQQMRNAYMEIRHISHHLLPVELEKGFETAIKRLLNDLNHNRKINFQLDGIYPKDFLSKEMETELYSICLELINNTIKHSESTECLVAFISSESTLQMTLTDNGKGFDPLDLKQRGQGLANIRERIESLNGTFTIDSEPGKGATFKIEFLN